MSRAPRIYGRVFFACIWRWLLYDDLLVHHRGHRNPDMNFVRDWDRHVVILHFRHNLHAWFRTASSVMGAAIFLLALIPDALPIAESIVLAAKDARHNLKKTCPTCPRRRLQLLKLGCAHSPAQQVEGRRQTQRLVQVRVFWWERESTPSLTAGFCPWELIGTSARKSTQGRCCPSLSEREPSSNIPLHHILRRIDSGPPLPSSRQSCCRDKASLDLQTKRRSLSMLPFPAPTNLRLVTLS